MNKYIMVVGFYIGLLYVFVTKKCTTNDVCVLLCINMAITYVFKKDT